MRVPVPRVMVTGLRKNFGLKVTECCPSLVPFNVQEDWVKELQGLSLEKCFH